MKKLFLAILLVFVGVAAWRIGGRLSSDALSMAVGLLLGVVAGIPAALLMLAGNRRRGELRDDQPMHPQGARQGQVMPYGQSPYPQQPPVIVLAPGMQGMQGMPNQQGNSAMNFQTGYPANQPMNQQALPSSEQVESRRFKVVGEEEEWIDEW